MLNAYTDVALLVVIEVLEAFPTSAPVRVAFANVTESEVPTAWPIATEALEPSPGVCVIVTPVPATTSETKFPVVSVPRATLFG